MRPPVRPDAAYVTPPEYAARVRAKPETIIAAIKRGELEAIDLARPGARRPRYRISPEAIQAFERRRLAGPAPKTTRRKRQAVDYREYY